MADIIEFRYEVVVKLKRHEGGPVADDDEYLQEEVRGALDDAQPSEFFDEDEDETSYEVEDWDVKLKWRTGDQVMPAS